MSNLADAVQTIGAGLHTGRPGARAQRGVPNGIRAFYAGVPAAGAAERGLSMRRVCFLDVDGVLAPFSSIIRSRAQALDGRLVRRLARFVERHDLTVVLASTWRHEVGVGATVKLLAPSWPQAVERIRSSTPILHLPRGQEIAAWLRAVDDVESFVILDDARDLAPLTAFHVKTDSHAGLQPKDLVKAAAVLARQRLHR